MQFGIEDLLTHTHQSNEAIARLKLSAAGWQLQSVCPESVAGPQMYFYVWDLATGWTWSCSAPLADFHTYAPLVRGHPAELKLLVGALGGLIRQAAAHGAQVVDLEMANRMALLLSAYAGASQAGAHADYFPRGGHYFVARYACPPPEDVRLRPFASVAQPETILGATAVTDAFNRVLHLDRINHPDWFD